MPTYEEWRDRNWDRAHEETDMSSLTGTGLGGHLHTLGTLELLTADTCLLCIGVGDGTWVREANDRLIGVQALTALDVSPVAQRRMPYGVLCYTDPCKLSSGVFDLAMSLWVAPHMSNHDLQTQMREVFRSLTPDGILALHYKEPLDPNDVVDNLEGTKDEWRRAAQAGILRRRGHFEQMVQWSGGQVVDIVQENKSSFHGVNEVSIHLKRSSR